ncbi:MAG: hypothetical protein DRR19_30470 [Candidatus Parabeggiatoa sp. nov. 1]|nr:MAG: hypothetical protein DRR19_30470 [Gammaproteobacteria bacterium]
MTETPYWHLRPREIGIWLVTVCVAFLLFIDYSNIYTNPVSYGLSLLIIVSGLSIIFWSFFLKIVGRKINQLMDEMRKLQKRKKSRE